LVSLSSVIDARNGVSTRFKAENDLSDVTDEIAVLISKVEEVDEQLAAFP